MLIFDKVKKQMPEMDSKRYIVVENCAKESLKTVLGEWCVEYEARLNDNLRFEIAETPDHSAVMRVDSRLDDTLFYYLVNYCSYPFSAQKPYKVKAYTVGNKHKALKGKRLMVFIDENDDEGDNVWMGPTMGRSTSSASAVAPNR